ncbi:hypothetical protein [Geomonas propionica]|uniref:Uncharacterized protein n=1 Tax=Geomonas propionica TaxID=2798582 RepID=A0ABS0YXQ3_9BACT|nr:hypothetical protein [Geomonas propionica]MBJ6802719.1 hypothetical protein [Geomonas propionica]
MKLILVVAVVVLFLSPTQALAAEEPCHAPQRAMPRPPWSPLRFALTNGNDRQSLEVEYIDGKTISFRIKKSGTCTRHERGRATIAEKWCMGAETDENEAGEAVAVEEYVYKKGTQFTIYIRIDESAWMQATIREAAECSNNCLTSSDLMQLKKEEKHRTKLKKN